MAILAGIDEAGLGPILGPLVVSGVAFRVPDEKLDGCLWQRLRASCSADPRQAARRTVIADSKKLYRPGDGLATLERTALVALHARKRTVADLDTLLTLVSPSASEQFTQYDWYRPLDLTLPLDAGTGDVATRANALRKDFAAQRIEPLGAFCEPLPEGHYNRLVGKTRNKNLVLLGLALKVVDRIVKCARPDERIRLFIDRLGGRVHYRESLSLAWPGFDLRILEESPHRSAYRLERRPRVLEIEFGTKGDTKHFPTALASIYSKYLRELFMHLFNRYWGGVQDGLKPTAGYYNDALRWLDDAQPAIDRRKIKRNWLVRER